MEASKKLFAMFLICIFVISSSVDISMASKAITNEKFRKTYEHIGSELDNCYYKCSTVCATTGRPKDSCNTQCGGDCVQRILQDTLRHTFGTLMPLSSKN
ncbi:hypothetical protein KY285_025914 [Solanum tuberosum]|nr:hypothetical protein KY285_025914 [Solanum tuberosum]